MKRPRLLDLYAGAGGCSVGYERAGFDVVGVDHLPQRHYRGGTFVQADALEYVAAHGHEFDAIHASPPCQAHSSLRALQPTKEYPDLIPATRAALVAAGKPYVIENVPGAPLGGGDTYLLMLCGTMFGLVTPDGRAEIRRHRLFETNWCFGLRPACQHGGPALSVAGHAHEVVAERQRARQVLTVAGHDYHAPALRKRGRCVRCRHSRHGHRTDAAPNAPAGHCRIPMRDGFCACAAFVEAPSRRCVLTIAGEHPHSPAVRHEKRRAALTVTGTFAEITGADVCDSGKTRAAANRVRETFSVDDARAAMGIDWMPMSRLSQAIPPAYAHWIGTRLLAHLFQTKGK